MKKFLFPILFAFVAITTAAAQSDFNYSFYPAQKYTKFETVNKRDTTTKAITAKSDTVVRDVNVLVEKNNSRFSVRTLANVSETLYDMNVRFLGMDENGNMVYRALTNDGETIFVNPMRGVVEIVFQKCAEEPIPGQPGTVKKYCDVVRHIFGNIAAPKPQIQPTPKK